LVDWASLSIYFLNIEITKQEDTVAQLQTGAEAPAFSLIDQDGNTVNLSEFGGKKLLLYFYPKADTPGCTTQACSIRDETANLSGLGIAAVGISPDQPEKLKKFRDKYDLNRYLGQEIDVWQGVRGHHSLFLSPRRAGKGDSGLVQGQP